MRRLSIIISLSLFTFLFLGCGKDEKQTRTQSVQPDTAARVFTDGRFGYVIEGGSVTVVADAALGVALGLRLVDVIDGEIVSQEMIDDAFVEVILSHGTTTTSTTRIMDDGVILQEVSTVDQPSDATFELPESTSLSTEDLTWNINYTQIENGGDFWFERRISPSTLTQPRPHAAKLTILGSESDQALVDRAMKGLIDSTHPWYPISFNPFGATSDGYEFHFYWDADVYMLPALLILEPRRAATIARYRLDTLPQARRNFDEWVDQGMPTATHRQQGSFRISQSAFRPAMYAWQADIDGVEQGIGETRYAHHATGSVALGVELAAAFGLVDSTRTRDFLRSISSYYLLRASTHSSGLYTIADTVSPDEWTVTDVDLYTNSLAEKYAQIQVPNMEFVRPKDEKGFLNFAGVPPPNYKQESGLLAAFPLQDARAEAQAMHLLERFGNHISPTGPAMSYGVQTVIQSRFGSPDEALTKWRNYVERFTVQPGQQIGEFDPSVAPARTVFVTGCADMLNGVLYGFLGIRIDDRDPGEKPFKTRLNRGFWLSVSPNLPAAWDGIVVEPVKLSGVTYRITATHSEVKVEPL